jgi:translation initiation factor 2B subunit (eIF-2B alpha/beta/delta family)
VFGEPRTWQEQIESIIVSRRMGSSDVAKRCAKALLAYTEQEHPGAVEQVTYAVSDVITKVLRCHPSMAAVARILNDAALAVSGAETVRSALDQLRRVCNEYLAWAEQAGLLVVESFIQVLPASVTLLTLSYSGAVARCIVEAKHRGYHVRVICLESRPVYEGRKLATYLSGQAVDVSVLIDAAALEALQEAHMFVVGAESIIRAGVLSKIGTRLVASAALAQAVPTYVIGDTSKVWPSSLEGPIIREHGVGEVWSSSPSGITIRNSYFDVTPWSHIGGIITERGIIGEQDVAQIGDSVEVARRTWEVMKGLSGK